MKRLLLFSLLFASLSISAKTKTVILGYTIDLDEPDSIVVDLKDGSFTKISMKDIQTIFTNACLLGQKLLLFPAVQSLFALVAWYI